MLEIHLSSIIFSFIFVISAISFLIWHQCLVIWKKSVETSIEILSNVVDGINEDIDAGLIDVQADGQSTKSGAYNKMANCFKIAIWQWINNAAFETPETKIKDISYHDLSDILVAYVNELIDDGILFQNRAQELNKEINERNKLFGEGE